MSSELHTTLVLVRAPAADHFNYPIIVKVGHGHAFHGCIALINNLKGPGTGMSTGILGKACEKQRRCPLIPENQLGMTFAQHVADHEVVMLGLGRLLDDMAFPRAVVIGMGFSHHQTSLLELSPPATKSRWPSPSTSKGLLRLLC